MMDLVSEIGEKKVNPLYAMMDSGARGNRSQAKQLGGMRGLMSKPSGEVIEWPVTANFREGLSVIEYFNSSHGARKGLADTALKTADSGYLTRRLVDVAQEVIVTEADCGTLSGVDVAAIKQGHEELLPLKDRIYGRVVCNDIYMPGDRSQLLAKSGDQLTADQAEAIDDAGIESVRIRSPLTCESARGICAKCYGLNLANGRDISLGEAVGVIAAQSIGEPGTQLTMNTFHLGGIASVALSPELESSEAGVVVYEDVRTVTNKEGKHLVLNKNGAVHLVRDEKRPLDELKRLLKTKSIEPIQTFEVDLGTALFVEDGASVKASEKIGYVEQHNIPIICDKPGYVQYEDLVEGISTQKEVNKQTGQVELIVKQHRGELHPQVFIYSDKECKELVGSYAVPSGAILSVKENDLVEAGDIIARVPGHALKTRDITGGLPRVAELFEARRPKDSAVIARLDGVVDFKGVQKNKRIVSVRDEVSGMEEEHLIPLTKHLIVQRGDMVVKGQQLTDGLVVPQEVLEVCGVRELQRYLVAQVQEVYRLQGVDINDKHIELIIRQMLQKLRVVDPGDTTFLYGEEVSKKAFHAQNQKVVSEGGKPATAEPLLLGITKASLGTESFIAAASFQDTTRVLTRAAGEGMIDHLRSAKENVTMGHMIPIGTGFDRFSAKFTQDEGSQELVFSF